MSKKLKLIVIYKVIANKTLDTGCIVRSKAYKKNMIIEQAFTASGVKHGRLLGESTKDTLYLSYVGYTGDVSEDDVERVIGHDIMIGDVLKYIEDHASSFCRPVDIENFSGSYGVGDEVGYTLISREYKTSSLQNQSEQYIDRLYSIIKTFK